MGDIHDELREVMGLLGKATPGPWAHTKRNGPEAPASIASGMDRGMAYAVAMCPRFRGDDWHKDADAIVSAVTFLRQHGPALLARQEGEDARDAARYRWLKANFQADYCRSTSDYWRITGEHDTPQELHIGNGELTLDYLVDAARSGGGG